MEEKSSEKILHPPWGKRATNKKMQSSWKLKTINTVPNIKNLKELKNQSVEKK